jgi:hypothetical protein
MKKAQFIQFIHFTFLEQKSSLKQLVEAIFNWFYFQCAKYFVSSVFWLNYIVNQNHRQNIA